MTYEQKRAVDHEFADLNLAVLGVGEQSCLIKSSIPSRRIPLFKTANPANLLPPP
jgi:hypothetical protein